MDLGYLWDVVSLTVVSRTQGNNFLTFTDIQVNKVLFLNKNINRTFLHGFKNGARVFIT